MRLGAEHTRKRGAQMVREMVRDVVRDVERGVAREAVRDAVLDSERRSTAECGGAQQRATECGGVRRNADEFGDEAYGPFTEMQKTQEMQPPAGEGRGGQRLVETAPSTCPARA